MPTTDAFPGLPPAFRVRSFLDGLQPVLPAAPSPERLALAARLRQMRRLVSAAEARDLEAAAALLEAPPDR